MDSSRKRIQYTLQTGLAYPLQLLILTGKIIDQFEWNGKSVRIDVSGYARGMYFLKMLTPDKTEIKKIILH